MRKLFIVLAILALAVSANAQVVNGTFDDGLNGWVPIGAGLVNGDFGAPASPSGNPTAGVVTSWGGNWSGPIGSIQQTVEFDGLGILSGEYYAGARFSDTSRAAGVEVLWNGVLVASKWQDSQNAWAAEFPWDTFAVEVTGVGVNTLLVNFHAHSAEWTWTQVDNLAITPVPEPSSMLALGTGLMGLAGFAFRRRK